MEARHRGSAVSLFWRPYWTQKLGKDMNEVVAARHRRTIPSSAFGENTIKPRRQADVASLSLELGHKSPLILYYAAPALLFARDVRYIQVYEMSDIVDF